MADHVQALKELQPQREFFIGIDSDGCAFDTMEIKHKECFCPNYIKHFNLQAVSKFAREAWDYVNLYSKDRGCNRFLAILKAVSLLAERPEVRARNCKIEQLPTLQKWTEEETKLGNPALKAKVEATGDEELTRVLAWSEAVNATIADMVHGVPPFPGVRESLTAAEGRADLLVVSQTPFEALDREWREHDIAKHVRYIAGQEAGTKAEHLRYAAVEKYPPEKTLMIGDAYGDLKAAEANGALFYPVLPGREDESWKRFYEEALPRFFAGTYRGEYEEVLRRELATALPDIPPWKR